MRSFGRCRQQIARFSPLSAFAYQGFRFPHLLFPRLTEVEDDTFDNTLAIRLNIGRDFAVTPSSPEYCGNIFTIASVQTVELILLKKIDK